MRDLDLKTLRLLVAVCEHGNIKQAARLEHIEPSAISKRIAALEAALDFEHVGLPPSTAVHAMLQRAAAGHGKSISYRAIVSNFDAAFRVVAAGLAISVVPRQVGEAYAATNNVRIASLTDTWARRRFAICFRSLDSLQPAAARLLQHLMARGEEEAGK